MGAGSAATGSTVWAVADIAFLLLIVFVLGVSPQNVSTHAMTVDTSMLQGDEVPSAVKVVVVQALMSLPAGQTEPSFRVSVESEPHLVPRSSFEALDHAELVDMLKRLRSQLDEQLAANPAYRLSYVFSSPPSAPYETVLRTYVALEKAIGGSWSVGLHRPVGLEREEGL